MHRASHRRVVHDVCNEKCLCIGCADHAACWLCRIFTKHFPFKRKRISAAIPDSCFRWHKTGASRIQLSVSTNTPGMPKRYANTAHFIEATALHHGTSLSVRTILGIRCQASSSQNRMSLVGSEVDCHTMRAKVRAQPDSGFDLTRVEPMHGSPLHACLIRASRVRPIS